MGWKGECVRRLTAITTRPPGHPPLTSLRLFVPPYASEGGRFLHQADMRHLPDDLENQFDTIIVKPRRMIVVASK